MEKVCMGPMRWASGRMQAPCMEDSLTACDPEIITWQNASRGAH